MVTRVRPKTSKRERRPDPTVERMKRADYEERKAKVERFARQIHDRDKAAAFAKRMGVVQYTTKERHGAETRTVTSTRLTNGKTLHTSNSSSSTPVKKQQSIPTPKETAQRINKPKVIQPQTVKVRDRGQSQEQSSSPVNLRVKGAKPAYAAQDQKSDRFSVSSLTLAGRTANEATRYHTTEELEQLQKEQEERISPYIKETRTTRERRIPGSTKVVTVTETKKELNAPKQSFMVKVPLIGSLFKTKEQKEFEKNVRQLAITNRLLDERRNPDKYVESQKRSLSYLRNRDVTQLAIGLGKGEGLQALDRLTKKHVGTEELQQRRKEINKDIVAQERYLQKFERPSNMLITSTLGMPNAASRIMGEHSERKTIDRELKRRGVQSGNLMSGKSSKYMTGSDDVAANKVVLKDANYIVNGIALEGGEVLASAAISAGAVKFAQSGRRAFKVVEAIDKIDQVQDIAQAGTGVYQIATGNVVGGAQNLVNLATTEAAAGHASRRVGGALSFTPDEKVSLKDRLFPKGPMIEYEGVDLSGLKTKTSPGIERVNAQLRGRTVPDNTPLPKEIQLRSGEVQFNGEKFKRTTQFGKLQSVGGKEVRGNTFKDSWKAMWRSKKASLGDVAMPGGPDFTSRFDVTPEVETRTQVQSDVATKTILKPEVTVKSLTIDESLSSAHPRAHRGVISVSPELSASLSPDISLSPDVTTKPDITVKPDVTVTPDESIETSTSVTPDYTAKSDVSVRSDISLSPDISTKLDLGLSNGLSPALGALIGKPKRGRRHIYRPRNFGTYTVNNKILDISKPFKERLRSYDKIKLPIDNRVKIPLGKRRTKKGRIYMPKVLKGFM